MPSLDQMNQPQEDPTASSEGQAPLEAQASSEQAPNDDDGIDELSDEEKLDLKLVVKMAAKLMGEGGGMGQVKAALQSSKDPAAVLGPFFATLFGKLQESLPKDLNVSPRVYLCKGGVLEQLLDYMENKFGLPPEFSDNVFGSVIETIKAAAQGEQKAMAPPPPGGQPVPQQQEQAPPSGGGLQGVA